MKVQTSIEGVTKTVLKMQDIQNTSIKALVQGLYLEGERVMADSKDNYVPVKSGTLKASGRVHAPVDLGGGKWEVTLSYGGPASHYALTVHEAPKSWGQGKNKYLQKPFKASLPKFEARMAAWVELLK
jgi:hypothetical protein